MADQQCIEFLQWALPRLRLPWPGFLLRHRVLGGRVATSKVRVFAEPETCVVAVRGPSSSWTWSARDWKKPVTYSASWETLYLKGAYA
jgi:hypothetical protein